MKNIGYLLFQADQKITPSNGILRQPDMTKKNPNLYYNIGSIYDDLGELKLAEQYLSMALELNKDDIEGRLRLAQSLFNKNKLKEAKHYVNEIP